MYRKIESFAYPEPNTRPGAWFNLTLHDNRNDPEDDWPSDFTLSGQVRGFGEGGNHGAECWLKRNLPQDVIERIDFDSEAGWFVLYGDDVQALRAVPHAFEQAIRQVERAQARLD